MAHAHIRGTGVSLLHHFATCAPIVMLCRLQASETRQCETGEKRGIPALYSSGIVRDTKQ